MRGDVQEERHRQINEDLLTVRGLLLNAVVVDVRIDVDVPWITAWLYLLGSRRVSVVRLDEGVPGWVEDRSRALLHACSVLLLFQLVPESSAFCLNTLFSLSLLSNSRSLSSCRCRIFGLDLVSRSFPTSLCDEITLTDFALHRHSGLMFDVGGP